MSSHDPRIVQGLCVLLAAVGSAAPAAAQHGTQGGEWRHFGGDSGATRYAPLEQIDRDSFPRLEVAETAPRW